MALSEDKRRGFIKRLLLSRMRILCTNGFYGLLLMHMAFALDDSCPTAATNGTAICFNTRFLDGLSDSELDFVMTHEVMHCVLQHVVRGDVFEPERYNIAADIVVNSNILKSNDMATDSISLHGKILMHTAPDGREGYYYTAEQVYAMLKSVKGKSVFDDHSRWREADEDVRDLWVKRFEDACMAIEIQEANSGRSILPLFAKRALEGIKNPQIDWRAQLNEFIQEEVCDYSFSPPDRRFEGDFFLPDFSDRDYTVKDILFMIDTSGSMSDSAITAAYSEVNGALEQFNGKLKGWLGFFEAGIIEPIPFSDASDLKVIKPAGGGGTDFGIVFEYVKTHMKNNLPASIIIMTDGYAPFPPEKAAMNIPVLWLLNNKTATPTWGRVARINTEGEEE